MGNIIMAGRVQIRPIKSSQKYKTKGEEGRLGFYKYFMINVWEGGLVHLKKGEEEEKKKAG